MLFLKSLRNPKGKLFPSSQKNGISLWVETSCGLLSQELTQWVSHLKGGSCSRNRWVIVSFLSHMWAPWIRKLPPCSCEACPPAWGLTHESITFPSSSFSLSFYTYLPGHEQGVPSRVLWSFSVWFFLRLFFFLFDVVLFVYSFFETGSPCLALAVLELTWRPG